MIEMLKAGVQMCVGCERWSLSWPAEVNPVPSLSLSTQNTSHHLSAAQSQTTRF